MTGPAPIPLIAGLQKALQAARSVHGRGDLDPALATIAEVVGQTLGFGAVVINVHRPAWDDFRVAAIHGDEEAHRVLAGTFQSWADWAPFLSAEFERRGAQHILAGQIDPERDTMPVYRPPGEVSDDPGAWNPADDLLVVLRDPEGEVTGVISVDEPYHRRRPSDAELDLLVVVAQLAGHAIQQAQAAARDAEHRAALERLLGITSRIANAREPAEVLDEVCGGISEVLGFQRVVVQIPRPDGTLEPVATAGWPLDDATVHVDTTMEALEPVMQPEFEREGCYLLGHEDAEERLGLAESFYHSRHNGRGPYAWHRHWLLVPLTDADGRRCGLIWADEPSDNLLPDAARLQALRLFADQAASALRAAERHADSRHRAAHDPLTGLPNRVTLVDRLELALHRARRSSEPTLAVLFIDLDRFKTINDRHGHAAGDEVLRAVASRIDGSMRPGDTIARLGGDEFVALCEDLTGTDEAVAIAERLRRAVALPVTLSGGGTVHVTASVGLALPAPTSTDAELLLREADRAMYRAKNDGRDAARLA